MVVENEQKEGNCRKLSSLFMKIEKFVGKCGKWKIIFFILIETLIDSNN